MQQVNAICSAWVLNHVSAPDLIDQVLIGQQVYSAADIDDVLVRSGTLKEH